MHQFAVPKLLLNTPQARSKQAASKQLRRALCKPQSSSGPKILKKVIPRYPVWFSATTFFGPPPVRNGDSVVFWPVLGLGHLKKFRAQAKKNRKKQFPNARGPETENHSYHAVRDCCPHLSYGLCFNRPEPHGQENAKKHTRIFSHSGLGRPLALGQTMGPDQKQKIATSWC